MNEAMKVGWIAAGAAILGGLLSGAYQHFRDWRLRPILKVNYENSSPDQSPTPYMPHAEWHEEGAVRLWMVVRVKVSNMGRRTARNCRVFLTDLEEVNVGGGLRRADFVESMVLPWPGWDFEPRNLPSSVTAFVDVIRFRKDVPAWNFPFRGYSGNLNTLGNFVGVYRFSMVVTADNADSVEYQIDVEYRNDWHNLRARRVL